MYFFFRLIKLSSDVYSGVTRHVCPLLETIPGGRAGSSVTLNAFASLISDIKSCTRLLISAMIVSRRLQLLCCAYCWCFI